jgi:hypothetical protein
LVCRHLYCILTYIPLAICPRVVPLEHMVVLFLVFWGICILIFIVAALIYIPTTAYKCSFPLNICYCFLDDSRSDQGRIESQCSFDLHILYGWECWTFFRYLLILLLLKINSFAHLWIGLFALLVFSFCDLYIFWMLIPYQINIWQRISPILWAVSSLWWLLPLMCRSFLNLMQSHLLVLALSACTVESHSETCCLYLNLEIFFLYFPGVVAV